MWQIECVSLGHERMGARDEVNVPEIHVTLETLMSHGKTTFGKSTVIWDMYRRATKRKT